MERRKRKGEPALRRATEDPLESVRSRLLRQAFVFDDPAAYAAGVEDALAAVADLSVDDQPGAPPGPSGPTSDVRLGVRGVAR